MIPAAVDQGITTSSEITTGLPAVIPAGVGTAAPTPGPGEPPGPTGTDTPAGMPPSITAPLPPQESQPAAAAGAESQHGCC
jgi:hypothetical protein